MTCIVGWSNGKDVWIGGDSASVIGPFHIVST